MKQYFDAAFFAGNRQSLMRQLRGGALVVMTAYAQVQRGYDFGYRLEQEPNFWYLTGIEQPDWRLIIDGSSNQTWLVRAEIDATRELFDGSLSADEATRISGIKDIIDPIAAKQLIARLRKHHTIVQTIAPQVIPEQYGFVANPAHKVLMKELASFQIQDCRGELRKLRAIKQPAELTAMQAAIDVTIAGIKTGLGQLSKLKHEYEFEAVLSGEFRRTGGRGHFFDPIVASGANACQVHYMDNDSPLSRADWLLVDVGARVSAYGADISRTVPLGRAPTKRQISIYEAALRVHDAAINLCRPGQSVKEYLAAVDQHMTNELMTLGIITEPEQMRTYFPYAIGHGLGLDVHDSLGGPAVFAENMVMTVEPGIQIPTEGFSVRIEDDILITADGPVMMSRNLPTKLDALQKLIA